MGFLPVVGVSGDPGPAPTTPEEYAAGLARAAAARAAYVPVVMPCSFCQGGPGVSKCTCEKVCAHADCWQRSHGGWADMPGMQRAIHGVPRFRHCPTYEELRNDA